MTAGDGDGGGFYLLKLPRLSFFQNLRFTLPFGFLFCKLEEVSRRERSLKCFVVVFLKGLKFSKGGHEWGRARFVCVCVVFPLFYTMELSENLS